MKRICLLVALMISVPGCEPLEPQLNGESCVMDSECESMLCVTKFEDGVEVAGGICTAECNNGVDCVEGEVCLFYSHTEEHYCFLECEVLEDCREGWNCAFVGPGFACIPPLDSHD